MKEHSDLYANRLYLIRLSRKASTMEKRDSNLLVDMADTEARSLRLNEPDSYSHSVKDLMRLVQGQVISEVSSFINFRVYSALNY